ncbi:hypothetical protein ATANTOWER_027163 [Ataeniobius toweri]|uniref:LAGLIDADG homing endonuclease n=1 Tax=Ataeniobius toweri TaxID=208326 RepID=A0ABU7BTK7_9TELE|nr:hypothetical protein [Ataeniobius toweri]
MSKRGEVSAISNVHEKDLHIHSSDQLLQRNGEKFFKIDLICSFLEKQSVPVEKLTHRQQKVRSWVIKGFSSAAVKKFVAHMRIKGKTRLHTTTESNVLFFPLI